MKPRWPAGAGEPAARTVDWPYFGRVPERTQYVAEAPDPPFAFAWVFFASLIVWAIIKAVMGLRVTEEEEYEGVDVAECGLEAYPEFTSTR